jgi:hypothetical protein
MVSKNANGSMLEVEVDEATLKAIELKLGKMKKDAPRALKNAVNKTARDTKKELANTAQETYTIKTMRFKKNVAQKNATQSNPTATLKVRGKANNLKSFTTKGNTDAVAAKAKVLKTGGLKALDGNGTRSKAFLVTIDNGKSKKSHTGIFERKGKNRYPVDELYSLTAPGMVGSERVYGKLEPEITKTLYKNINAQIKKIMGGK